MSPSRVDRARRAHDHLAGDARAGGCRLVVVDGDERAGRDQRPDEAADHTREQRVAHRAVRTSGRAGSASRVEVEGARAGAAAPGAAVAAGRWRRCATARAAGASRPGPAATRWAGRQAGFQRAESPRGPTPGRGSRRRPPRVAAPDHPRPSRSRAGRRARSRTSSRGAEGARIVGSVQLYERRRARDGSRSPEFLRPGSSTGPPARHAADGDCSGSATSVRLWEPPARPDRSRGRPPHPTGTPRCTWTT